jgi:hypothetical protein
MSYHPVKGHHHFPYDAQSTLSHKALVWTPCEDITTPDAAVVRGAVTVSPAYIHIVWFTSFIPLFPEHGMRYNHIRDKTGYIWRQVKKYFHSSDGIWDFGSAAEGLRLFE